MSAADCETVDGGDDWFGYAANETVETFNLKHARLRGAVVAERSALLLIATAAERLIASAGQDDRSYRGVDPGVRECGEQLIDRAPTHRVVAIWAIDGDDGGALAHLVENVGELGWLKHLDPFAIEAIIRGFGDRQKERSGESAPQKMTKNGALKNKVVT